MKMNPEMMPIMVAALEKDDLDSVGITNLAEEELLSELESLEGVASVSTSGGGRGECAGVTSSG